MQTAILLSIKGLPLVFFFSFFAIVIDDYAVLQLAATDEGPAISSIGFFAGGGTTWKS